MLRSFALNELLHSLTRGLREPYSGLRPRDFIRYQHEYSDLSNDDPRSEAATGRYHRVEQVCGDSLAHSALLGKGHRTCMLRRKMLEGFR